jgi:uncharacterized membrane protein
MRTASDNLQRHEQIIAGLLWYGTWLASALLVAGVLLTAVLPSRAWHTLTGYDVVKTGVAVFILLPVVRVALMLTIFLRQRDYTHSLIAALVLTIIAAGVLVEI